MRALTSLLIAAFVAAPAASQNKPFIEPGTQRGPSDPPLQAPQANDQWADMLLTVAKTGHPTGCRVANSNIRDSEMRYYFCQAMMQDWHIEPKLENGLPVKTTVMRHMVMPGRALRHPQAPRANP